jgi:hypothetical protein
MNIALLQIGPEPHVPSPPQPESTSPTRFETAQISIMPDMNRYVFEPSVLDEEPWCKLEKPQPQIDPSLLDALANENLRQRALRDGREPQPTERGQPGSYTITAPRLNGRIQDSIQDQMSSVPAMSRPSPLSLQHSDVRMADTAYLPSQTMLPPQRLREAIFGFANMEIDDGDPGPSTRRRREPTPHPLSPAVIPDDFRSVTSQVDNECNCPLPQGSVKGKERVVYSPIVHTCGPGRRPQETQAKPVASLKRQEPIPDYPGTRWQPGLISVLEDAAERLHAMSIMIGDSVTQALGGIDRDREDIKPIVHMAMQYSNELQTPEVFHSIQRLKELGPSHICNPNVDRELRDQAHRVQTALNNVQNTLPLLGQEFGRHRLYEELTYLQREHEQFKGKMRRSVCAQHKRKATHLETDGLPSAHNRPVRDWDQKRPCVKIMNGVGKSHRAYRESDRP